MRLNDKTILITGASRGIGRAFAEELAKQPVHLLLGMRDTKDYRPIEAAQATITPVELDVSSLKNIQAALKDAPPELHKLDILINNAGQYLAGPLDKQDLEKVDTMVQVNLTGLMQLTAELLPILRKNKGKIVNNASIAGYVWLPFNSTYTATKAGVVAFSEALRRELSTSGVSVLHLATPVVATDMFQNIQATYQDNGRPIKLTGVPADVWARKVVKAIEADKTILTPSGNRKILRWASKGPRFLIDLASNRLVK